MPLYCSPPSKGSYFSRNIRGRFAYARVSNALG